ncbi:MAG: cobalamin biosynthesis protein CbiX [Proteobacteria bacterium]|nr:cobalamin biosynthesis protein CbiX [Pseudomonadota bacterium]
MRRAILIVDHGSRRSEANALLDAVAERVRARAPEVAVHVAHMELAAPSIAEGLDACKADGAGEVVVHPFFLGPGNHTSEDIPRLVEEAAAQHPDLVVRISAPLGPHEKLIDILLERVNETR